MLTISAGSVRNAATSYSGVRLDAEIEEDAADDSLMVVFGADALIVDLCSPTRVGWDEIRGCWVVFGSQNSLARIGLRGSVPPGPARLL